MKDADPQALGPHVELFRKHVGVGRAGWGGFGGGLAPEGAGGRGEGRRKAEGQGARAARAKPSAWPPLRGRPDGATGFSEQNNHLFLF